MVEAREGRGGGWEGVGHVHGPRTGGLRTGGEGGKRRYIPRGRNGLQVLILVRERPRTGAEPSGKAIGWNRSPREDRSTI